MNTFKFMLDRCIHLGHNVNMFNIEAQLPAKPATRRIVLSAALDFFRQRGLDGATMRDIANYAGVALGAAYYYFPSKEAIVQAYYDHVQAFHLAKVSEQLAASEYDLPGRLRIAFHTKLDILQGDRKLLGALFRYTGEPQHPLSIFGPASRANREQSIAVFRLAVGEERLPEDIREVLPLALWALSMGILLYFIYDDSPQQERTRKLVDGALELVVRILALAKSPLLKSVRKSLFSLMREAGISPEPPSLAPVSDQEA
jgi:AcrR family transcriptional regulator